MFIKRSVLAVTVFGLLSAAASARAQDVGIDDVPASKAPPVAGEAAYSRPGLYASLGGLYGIENFSSSNFDNSGGYDIRVGKRLREMWAAEVHWQAFPKFSSKNSATPDMESYMLSLNGKFFPPLPGRFQPYGLFGLGWYHAQADRVANTYHAGSFASRFAIGLDVYATESLGLEVETAYVLPMTASPASDDLDVIPITGSIFYRFQ